MCWISVIPTLLREKNQQAAHFLHFKTSMTGTPLYLLHFPVVRTTDERLISLVEHTLREVTKLFFVVLYIVWSVMHFGLTKCLVADVFNGEKVYLVLTTTWMRSGQTAIIYHRRQTTRVYLRLDSVWYGNMFRGDLKVYTFPTIAL